MFSSYFVVSRLGDRDRGSQYCSDPTGHFRIEVKQVVWEQIVEDGLWFGMGKTKILFENIVESTFLFINRSQEYICQQIRIDYSL